jgi:hypothetical protein
VFPNKIVISTKASARSFVRSQQTCDPDRSEAKWRDLLFIIPSIESE